MITYLYLSLIIFSFFGQVQILLQKYGLELLLIFLFDSVFEASSELCSHPGALRLTERSACDGKKHKLSRRDAEHAAPFGTKHLRSDEHRSGGRRPRAKCATASKKAKKTDFKSTIEDLIPMGLGFSFKILT